MTALTPVRVIFHHKAPQWMAARELDIMTNIVSVNFREDTLFAVERDDGVYVAVKPICDAIGLAWNSQLQRLKNDPVLGQGMTTVIIPSPGGAQETTCLRLDLVNGWLFKVDARRVKDDAIREKVVRYQRECHTVLFEHFHGKRSSAPTITAEEEPQEPEAGRVRLVTECRQTFGNRAAGELWFKLGLPVTPSMLEDARQPSLLDYARIRTVDGGSQAA